MQSQTAQLKPARTTSVSTAGTMVQPCQHPPEMAQVVSCYMTWLLSIVHCCAVSGITYLQPESLEATTAL